MARTTATKRAPGRRRRPGRPSDPIPLSTIVAAARDLIAQRGYEAVSLREVAERVGVTKAALYYHFPTKAELYDAVLEEDAGAMVQLVAAARLDDGGYAERLDRLGALVCDYLSARPAVARLFLRELVGHGPYLTGAGAARVSEILALAAAFLEAGMDAGDFAPSDARQLAVSIAGLHLFAFAAADFVEPFLGASLQGARGLAARRAAVLAQVRRLCGLPVERAAGEHRA
ncbi:MAG: helix-turn-helix transcriptional regulator [Deltaproteobacteria bacterium]|nr:helix-turn-helix transcriptional regulator [Deltaproteobacteria bacterium]